jgi:hypothetical protein
LPLSFLALIKIYNQSQTVNCQPRQLCQAHRCRRKRCGPFLSPQLQRREAAGSTKACGGAPDAARQGRRRGRAVTRRRSASRERRSTHDMSWITLVSVIKQTALYLVQLDGFGRLVPCPNLRHNSPPPPTSQLGTPARSASPDAAGGWSVFGGLTGSGSSTSLRPSSKSYTTRFARSTRYALPLHCTFSTATKLRVRTEPQQE